VSALRALRVAVLPVQSRLPYARTRRALGSASRARCIDVQGGGHVVHARECAYDVPRMRIEPAIDA